MAQGTTRLIVFYGTEEQRRWWVKEKNLDPHNVLLAATARQRLLGRTSPVDTWIASGQDGLSREDSLALAQQIRLLNNLYDKETE